MFQLVWISTAAATALGIVLDLHRLRASRAGLSPAGWVLACACAGPLAGAVYLLRRRAVQRELTDAVWKLVGDASQPVPLRRERLAALRRSGLLGTPVYRACLAALDAEAARGSTQQRAASSDAGCST